MGTFKPWIKEMDEIIRSDKFFKSSLEEVQEFFRNSLEEWETKNCPMTTVADMHFPDLAIRRATKAIERDTQQAMESLVHNLCTLNSRSGSQTPFSSVNFGIDTSWAGRLVSKSLMDAIDAGLGLGETAIFPIAIMKLKKGITDKGSPNYDLFQQSCRVSAKRLFPNWVNLDAPFNLQYYKPDVPSSHVASMGCRTRVIANDYDPTHVQTDGRGNLFWTTVNLPYLALEAKEELIHEKGLNYHLSDVLPDDLIPTLYEKIVEKVDTTVDDVLDFSMTRFEIIAKRKAKNYPFSMCQHVYVTSEMLRPEDEVREVLKQGTISIGFIGLAETLITLMGKHHGESDLAQEYGLKLIRHMRMRTDKATKDLGFNFSLMGSPAEGCTGRLCRLIKKRWGVLPGITDKDYLVNSSHLPPKFKTTISNKVIKEAPYHELENAGAICYAELDAKTVDNTEGFEQIVTFMADAGCGYFAINHPVTRDPICGYVGPLRSDGTCPRCGRKSGEGVSVEKLLSLHAYSPDPEYAVTAAQLDQDDAVSNDVDF